MIQIQMPVKNAIGHNLVGDVLSVTRHQLQYLLPHLQKDVKNGAIIMLHHGMIQIHQLVKNVNGQLHAEVVLNVHHLLFQLFRRLVNLGAKPTQHHGATPIQVSAKNVNGHSHAEDVLNVKWYPAQHQHPFLRLQVVHQQKCANSGA